MQTPDLPTLEPELLESLPQLVQTHIWSLEQIIAAQQLVLVQLENRLQEQAQTQSQQLAQTATLQAQLAELQERLNQNSENSSKPPSSNPPWTRPAKTPKAGSDKKRGGQPGHTRS